MKKIQQLFSKNNASIKKWCEIRDGLSKDGTVMISGENIISESIESFYPIQFISTDKDLLTRYNDLYDGKSELFLVPIWLMEKVIGLKSSQYICAIGFPLKLTFPDSGTILILDDVQDPGNLGTIFRSAHNFGIKGIILSEGCCNINNQKTIRASRGSCFHIASKHINKPELYTKYPSNKTWITEKSGIGMSEAAVQIALSDISFVVMGNEGHGVSNSWHIECKKFWIPSFSESINVGCAASIIMYEVAKQSKLA